jgi:hypothetical protein
MATNYTGVDLDRYNAGNKFYSQDRYLQGIGLDKPAITFNPSQSNTGIMSQYPQYPIIPQYGGDGGGPIDPGGPGYGYTGPGSTGSAKGFDINDIGEGTIDDEDMPKGPGFGLMDAIRAGGAFMFGGPFSAANSLRKSYNRNKQAEIDRINKEINLDYGKFGGIGAREAQRRQDEAGGSVQSSDDYSSFGGQGDQGATGANFDGDFATDSASYDLAEGGRAGYSGGGVTNYKNFLEKKGYKDMMQNMNDDQIRSLYDSVMGTFSLRRAYGGIVGMYR